MTTDAVARWLEVPRARVQLWLRSGKLPGVKVSGQWRVPLDAVLELERRDRLRGRSRRLDPRYQEDDMARTIADDELSAAFWALADEQVALLRPHGQEVFAAQAGPLPARGSESRLLRRAGGRRGAGRADREHRPLPRPAPAARNRGRAQPHVAVGVPL